MVYADAGGCARLVWGLARVRMYCRALCLATEELGLPVEAARRDEGGMMPRGGRVRGLAHWVGRSLEAVGVLRSAVYLI